MATGFKRKAKITVKYKNSGKASQEINRLKVKIEKTKNNKVLTESQKAQLLEKYSKDIEQLSKKEPTV